MTHTCVSAFVVRILSGIVALTPESDDYLGYVRRSIQLRQTGRTSITESDADQHNIYRCLQQSSLDWSNDRANFRDQADGRPRTCCWTLDSRSKTRLGFLNDDRVLVSNRISQKLLQSDFERGSMQSRMESDFILERRKTHAAMIIHRPIDEVCGEHEEHARQTPIRNALMTLVKIEHVRRAYRLQLPQPQRMIWVIKSKR